MIAKTKMTILHLNVKPISLNHAYPTGANGRRYLSQEGKDFKELVGWEAKKNWGSIWLGDKSLKFCVVLNLRFSDHRKKDLDNFIKIILDSLTGIVWDDDSQVVDLHDNKRIFGERRI